MKRVTIKYNDDYFFTAVDVCWTEAQKMVSMETDGSCSRLLGFVTCDQPFPSNSLSLALSSRTQHVDTLSCKNKQWYISVAMTEAWLACLTVGRPEHLTWDSSAHTHRRRTRQLQQPKLLQLIFGWDFLYHRWLGCSCSWFLKNVEAGEKVWVIWGMKRFEFELWRCQMCCAKQNKNGENALDVIESATA